MSDKKMSYKARQDFFERIRVKIDAYVYSKLLNYVVSLEKENRELKKKLEEYTK